MTTQIIPTPTDDVIDSRDVIDAIDHLDHSGEDPVALAALKALAAEAEDYAEDWYYGVTLVRDTYFKEYAQQYADDCGYLSEPRSWPFDCIDWDHAARELQVDYSAVEFGDITYWVR